MRPVRNQTRFDLRPNPQFERCLAAHPDDPTRPPQATVTVKRGNLNDQLSIQLKNIKPGLAFALFTVARTTFKPPSNRNLPSVSSPVPAARHNFACVN